MSKLIGVQRRMREQGRIRFGAKTEKGYPTSLDTLRFTSQDRDAIAAVADMYGGEIREWTSPRGPEWECITNTAQVDCVVPPQPIGERQWFELWGKDRKTVELLRRCDGELQTNGEPCVCDPDKRDCKPTTHVVVMLPQLPGLGVWRFSTRGLNAAAELPDIVELLQRLAAIGKPTPAVLGITRRSGVVDGEKVRYVVPFLDIKGTAGDLLASLDPGERVAVLTGGEVRRDGPGSHTLSPLGPSRRLPSGADVIDLDSARGSAEPAVASVSDDDVAELLSDHLAALPSDDDTMKIWDAYCRQLFSLMERAGYWPADDGEGRDSLHVWLAHYHDVEHLAGLKKSVLIATTKRAHAKATEAVAS